MEDTSHTNFIIPAFFDFPTYEFEEVSLNIHAINKKKGLVVLPSLEKDKNEVQDLLTKLFGAIQVDFSKINPLYVDSDQSVASISYSSLDYVLVFGVDLKQIGIHIRLANQSAVQLNNTLFLKTESPSTLLESVAAKKQLWVLLKKYFLDTNA